MIVLIELSQVTVTWFIYWITRSPSTLQYMVWSCDNSTYLNWHIAVHSMVNQGTVVFYIGVINGYVFWCNLLCKEWDINHEESLALGWYVRSMLSYIRFWSKHTEFCNHKNLPLFTFWIKILEIHSFVCSPFVLFRISLIASVAVN